jgi:hypothetical protein
VNRIEQGHLPLRVGDDHRVADADERCAESLALGVDHVRGPLAHRHVRGEEPDDHHHQQQPEAEGDGGGEQRGPRAGPGGGVATRQERALRALHLGDLGADPIHDALALVGQQALARRLQHATLVRIRLVHADPALQPVEPLGHELLEPQEPHGLLRVVGDELPELGELPGDAGHRLLVGLQIAAVAGEQIAALPVLGVLQRREHLLELRQHLVGVGDPLDAVGDLADVVDG